MRARRRARQARPLAYASFAQPGSEDERRYLPIDSWERLKRLLSAKLAEYNDAHARMDLVLFEQATEHASTPFLPRASR